MGTSGGSLRAACGTAAAWVLRAACATVATLTLLAVAPARGAVPETEFCAVGAGDSFAAATDGWVATVSRAGVVTTHAVSGLINPYDCAVDPSNGDIIFVDQGAGGGGTNGVLYRLDTATTTLTALSTNLVNPRGVTVVADGTIYVADVGATTGGAPDGAAYSFSGGTLTRLDTGGVRLRNPVDLDIDPHPFTAGTTGIHVVVLDGGGRIDRVPIGGGNVTTVATAPGGGSWQGLEVGPYGKYFLSDSSTEGMVRFDRDTGLRTTIGPGGGAAGTAHFAIDYDTGDLFYADFTTDDLARISPSANNGGPGVSIFAADATFPNNPLGMGYAPRRSDGPSANLGVPTRRAPAPGTHLSITGPTLSSANGSVEHELDVFIEVTDASSPLRIRIFDADNGNGYDASSAGGFNSSYTYELTDPSGAALSTVTLAGGTRPDLDQRIAILNAGNTLTVEGPGVPITDPGLYRLRITADANDDFNGLGVWVETFQAYTFNVPFGPLENFASGVAPFPTSLDPARVYPYFDRGCEYTTSNFDMDLRANASVDITTRLGENIGLTLSGFTVHAEDTVDPSPGAGALSSIEADYGLHRLETTISPTVFGDTNIASVRVADYNGWVDGGGTSPPLIVPPGNAAANPTPALRQSPGPAYPQAPFAVGDNTFLRMYFPRYTDVVGTVPWATAAPPLAPYMSHAVTPISGDPPTVGIPSYYLVQVTVVNPDPQNATGAFVLTAPVPAPARYVDSGPSIGGGATATGGATVTTCGAPCSGNVVANWASGIAAGSAEVLSYVVEITPGAVGQRVYLTGGPEFRGGGATPAANPASLGGAAPGTVAAFRPAWSSAAFPRSESLGPLCDLSVVEGTVTPVAVDLASLSATAGDGEVLLEWETASEFENLGFRILRRLEGEGDYTLVTDGLILGRGTTDLRARYAFLDRTAPNGVAATYLLEDIELDGDSTPHGPVTATPNADAETIGFISSDYAASATRTPEDAAGTNATSADGASSAGIRAESSAVPRFVITSETPSEIRARLTLPEPSVEEVTRDGDLYSEVSLDGFDATLLPGAPALPARTYWLETAEAAFVDLSYDGLSGESMVLSEPLLPTPITANDDGRLAYRYEATHAAYRAEGVFPETPVSIVGTVRLADGRQLVGVRVQPVIAGFEMDAVTWYREIDITLGLRAVQVAATESPTDLQSEIARTDGVKIEVDRTGMIAVLGRELLAAGLDPNVDPRRLHIATGGARVLARFDGAWDGRLDSSDTLFLFAEPSEDRYSNRQVFYVFPTEVFGSRTTFVDASPQGPVFEGASVDAVVRNESQDVYLPGILNGEGDNFVGPFVFSTDRTVTLEAPAAAAGASQLRVLLRGGTTFPEIQDDHHFELRVAPGTPDEVRLDARFDGTDAFFAALELGVNATVGGSVPVVVSPQFDSGAPFDLIYIDALELHYRRSLNLTPADGGQLLFTAEEDGSHRLGGLSSPARATVWDVTDARAAAELDRLERDATSVVATLEAGRRYLVVDGGGAFAPATVRAQLASGFTHPEERHGADWLAIGHRSLLGELGELAAHRERLGLSTQIVDIDDVYDEASHGRETPIAIRDFLARVAAQWNPAPRYVLFVGEANYDYRNFLGGSAPNLVPTLLVDTTFVEAASDSALADLHGDDGAPDMAVGRLPVRDASELRAVIEKLIAYENLPPGEAPWTRQMLLVADDGVGAEAPDEAADFEAILDTVDAAAPSALQNERVALRDIADENEGAEANAAIREALLRGQVMTTYVGHGGARFWSDERIFGADDWETLENRVWPIFLVLNCLNAFFDAPNEEAFAEDAVAAEQRGAVAVVSSTTVSSIRGQSAFARQFSERLLGRNVHRVGDALQQALQSMSGEPGAFDVLATFVLIGDPATRIALPNVPIAHAGEDVRVRPALPVALDGSRSEVGGDGPASYRWRIVAGGGDGRLFETGDPARPWFRSSTSGSYTVELVVTQDGVESAPATVRVHVDGPSGFACAPGGGAAQSQSTAALDWLYFALPVLISRRFVRRLRRS